MSCPSSRAVRRGTERHLPQGAGPCRHGSSQAWNQGLPDQPRVCVPALCFPAFLSHCYRRLFFTLIIASHTARKEIFLCNKNSFGVFYSLLIHAKQESRHIALYGYKRSRLQFLMFLDNCTHNITTTLSLNLTLFKEEGRPHILQA